MIRLKRSLRNLVKPALLLKALFIISFLAGCSSSTSPTYSKESIDIAIQDICRDEYKIDAKAKLMGETLWIYLPMEDIFEKNNKPEKYTERYNVGDINASYGEGVFKFDYSVQAVPKETEKTQDYKYSKNFMDKLNSVWRVLRRVVFSLDRDKTGEPRLYCLIAADIKNGYEVREIFYYLDLKKVSYEYISWGEYQHRSIQESEAAPEIIGDKEGLHVNYRDIPMGEFLAAQIKQRIKLKFQRSEAERNADIDKEVVKVVTNTVKTYEFRDFSQVELRNLVTNNKTVLNLAAIWEKPLEKKRF